jgi:ribosomal protein L40E
MVPPVEIRRVRAWGVSVDGHEQWEDMRTALAPGTHTVGLWLARETLEVFTEPTPFGLAIGGVGAEYIIQTKNRSIGELAGLIPGVHVPPPPPDVPLEPRSAIVTHLETRLNLQAVRAQMEHHLLEASMAGEGRLEVRFWASTGDTAWIFDEGYIAILSANPFSGLAWPLVLQAELNKVVNLIADLFPNVPEERKRAVEYYKARFYADPAGIFHRLLNVGSLRGVLMVPRCEIRGARTDQAGPGSTYLQGKDIEGDVTNVVIPGSQLDVQWDPLSFLEVLTVPTQQTFDLYGEGVEKVLYQRNRSLRELVAVCPHRKFWNPPRATRCRKCERPFNEATLRGRRRRRPRSRS